MNADLAAEAPVVALVLGAAVWPGGVASPTLRRRAELGARLVLEGQAAAVIGCGGLGRHGPSEALVIAEICRAAGVPEDRVLVEDRSTSTEENIRFALPLLAGLGTNRVLIVTDRYHAPRAVLIARRLHLAAEARCTTLQGTAPLRIIKAYVREGFALARFALRGLMRR